jgi:RNA polymerase sigma-54 factor
MRPSLQLGLSQHLAMTPQLQQAIRLLQMSSLELEQEIQTTLESNLLLEQIEPSEPWDRIYFSKKSEFPFQKSTELTLREHLYWQMELAHLSEKEILIATSLIDAISEEGYLLCPLSEIQEGLNFKTTENHIEAILYRIQQFDPLGVGARNLSECLSIQLNHLPTTTPYITAVKTLVTEHLDILGKKDYATLKLRLDLSELELKNIIKILTGLNPRPGTQLSSKKSEYVIPDVIISKKNNNFLVELNKTILPTLRLNTDYARPGYLTFFKTHLKEAKWFLKSVQTRNETLLKVAQCIATEQKEFLEYGEEHMKPLSLQDIAQKTELHESTISRITTQKYILTPRGIVPLKYFFSNGISSKQGKEASTTAIRALIKKIIAEETSQTPFSDHKIRTLLMERGITIARRTVTKYREAMQVPSSNERKKLGFS